MSVGHSAVPISVLPTGLENQQPEDRADMNRVMSTFFSLGQTLPTYRHGVGIFQEALDDAIQILGHGNAWLHVFPEGRIRQSKDLSSEYPTPSKMGSQLT